MRSVVLSIREIAKKEMRRVQRSIRHAANPVAKNISAFTFVEFQHRSFVLHTYVHMRIRSENSSPSGIKENQAYTMYDRAYGKINFIQRLNSTIPWKSIIDRSSINRRRIDDTSR